MYTVVGYLVIGWFCGLINAAIAQRTGRSPGMAWLLGLLLGPIGVVCVFFLAPTAKNPRCIWCSAKLLAPDARVCAHCGRDQNPSTLVTPESPLE